MTHHYKIETLSTRRGALVASITSLLLGLSGPLLAQQSEELEEIVVVGIKGSIQRALDEKKNATEFVDAIASQDIGKLPDNNIAEALQRVPGVTIQRTRGEGNFVSIRGLGPDFVRGTINGRSLVSATETRDGTDNGAANASTGRATNFDVLPSEIIDVLSVYKTPAAEHIEGGIGGVIDIRTIRPLDQGKTTRYSVDATYRDFRDETDPSASITTTWVNDTGNLGLSGSLSYSERSLRQDYSRTFGFLANGNTFDTDGDGLGDVSGLQVASSHSNSTYVEDRERVSFNGTLQRTFDNDSELLIDVIYSDRDISHFELEASVSPHSLFGDGAFIGNGVVNADGSLQAPGLVVEDGTLVSYNVTSPLVVLTDDQRIEDTLFSIGFNYSIPLNGWDVAFDANLATAEGSSKFDRAVMNTPSNLFPFNFSTNSGLVVAEPTGDTSGFSDIANYSTRNADVVIRENDDTETAFKIDASRDLESSVFSAIKLGLRLRTRDKEVNDQTSFISGPLQAAGGYIPASQVGGSESFIQFGNNFLGGDSSFPLGDILFPMIAAQREAQLAAVAAAGIPGTGFNGFVGQFNPLSSYDISEDTYAFYAQLDFDTDFGGMPFTGNLGFRVVHTDQSVGGFSQPFEIQSSGGLGFIVFTGPDVLPFTEEASYTNVLPSLNVRLGLTDDLFLRAAVNKTVTRPTFGQLAPALLINATQVSASGGNPTLVAYESVNYDLGLEWYFSEASVLGLTVFNKEIENFIANVTNENVVVQGVTFVNFTQPDGQGEGRITGVELSYQHAFDSGFGYQLNATFVDTDAEFTSGTLAGQSIPFVGVSEESFNAVAYYENAAFNARLAFTSRSDFLRRAQSVLGDPNSQDDFEQLDASISYRFSDLFTVELSGINLTDEFERELSGFSNVRPASYSVYGRTFTIGVRGEFGN